MINILQQALINKLLLYQLHSTKMARSTRASESSSSANDVDMTIHTQLCALESRILVSMQSIHSIHVLTRERQTELHGGIPVIV